ncbi:MAG: energy-coupled thiamine transporter ThiT [Clostridia bacterium]|nr:energy-coupled thiamine transporter ThiT [Clostridia bacterium]
MNIVLSSIFSFLEEWAAWEWILFALCIAAVVGCILWLVLSPKKEKKPVQLRTLIYGAMCVALSFVLSYIKLWQMPMGGSVTLVSMLPLMVYANRFGLKNGLIAGLAYGLLQFIQKPEIYQWAQIIIDYPLAFMLVGLAGAVKNLQLGCLIGGFARFLCHFATGVIFFGEYAPEGMNVYLYSLGYNGGYMGVDTLLCIVLSIPLMLALNRYLPKRAE